MSGISCTVCGHASSKYKCPICERRSCSLSCFQQHKSGCSPSINEPGDSSKPLLRTGDAVPDDTVNNILRSENLDALFLKFPTLQNELNDIYNSTLDPTKKAEHGISDSSYAESRGKYADYSKGAGRGWTPEKGLESGLQSLKMAIETTGPHSDGLHEFLRLFQEKLEADGNA